MLTTKTVLIIYALLMMGGGYMGYAKAGSKISLIAGMVSGVLVLIGVYLTKSSASLGYGIAAGTSGLLVISFFIRLMKTKAFMPSGMLLALSLIALIISLRKVL